MDHAQKLAEKREALADLIVSPEGRKRIAGAMREPLRTEIRYRYIFGSVLTSAARTDKVFDGIEEVVIEEMAETPMDGIHERRRFDLIDRCKSWLQLTFGNAMYAHSLQLVRQAVLPTDEPFPEGWERVGVNTRTWDNLRRAGLLDPKDPDVLGSQHRHKKAEAVFARLVEPGLLYAFGKADDVGRYWFDVEVEDDSDAEMYRLRGKLTYRMALVEEPRVGLYRVELN